MKQRLVPRKVKKGQTGLSFSGSTGGGGFGGYGDGAGTGGFGGGSSDINTNFNYKINTPKFYGPNATPTSQFQNTVQKNTPGYNQKQMRNQYEKSKGGKPKGDSGGGMAMVGAIGNFATGLTKSLHQVAAKKNLQNNPDAYNSVFN